MSFADHRLSAAIRCGALLLLVIAGGTLGFWLIEPDWSAWKSLYFTLITITTVGYGDQGLRANGEKFAAVMLICGIGGFTYSVSTLIQLALDRDFARRRKMIQQIRDHADHIIVCGYGRMGRTICDQLTAGGEQCVVIECQEAGYEAAVADGRLAVLGAASEDEVLLAAGVERAKGEISVVDSDADNMFVVVSVRELNRNCTVVARAESESAARKMERAGASFVVLPHKMAGENVASAVLHPRLARVMQSGQDDDQRLVLGETEVQADSPLVGTTIDALSGCVDELVFVAISRAGGALVLRPSGNELLTEGDILICAGRQADFETIQEATCPAVCA